MRLGQSIDYTTPRFYANARYTSCILQFLSSHGVYDFWVVEYNFFLGLGALHY